MREGVFALWFSPKPVVGRVQGLYKHKSKMTAGVPYKGADKNHAACKD